MKEITPMNIIHDIAGDIPVEYDEIIILKGGGAYDEQRRIIKLYDPKGIDGRNLALCAHEAFHAKRHKEGVLMYDLPRNILRTPVQMKEEDVVNDLAEDYLASLPLTDEQRKDAAEMFTLSRTCYSTKSMVGGFLMLGVMVAAVRVQGWAQKRDGRKWTEWDEFKKAKKETEDRLNAPGIPVDDNGNLINTVEGIGI